MSNNSINNEINQFFQIAKSSPSIAPRRQRSQQQPQPNQIDNIRNIERKLYNVYESDKYTENEKFEFQRVMWPTKPNYTTDALSPLFRRRETHDPQDINNYFRQARNEKNP